MAERHAWLKQYDRSESIAHLEQLTYGDEQVDLIIDLLESFDFNTPNELTTFIYSSVKYIMTTLALDPKTVGFVAKKNEDGSFDSSKTILGLLQNIFPAESGFSKANIFPIARIALKNKDIENIILIDDFSGTGKSLDDYIIWMQEECEALNRESVKVHAFFFRALEATNSRKYQMPPDSLIIDKILPKGITDFYVGDKLVGEQISRMLAIEQKHGNIGKFSLGWGKSECLYSCEGISTPNNVFPIFWKRRSKKEPFHRPLLNRK